MKLRSLLFLTHVAPPGIAAAAIAAGVPVEKTVMLQVLAGCAGLASVLALFAAARVRCGLRLLERVAATGDAGDAHRSGIAELDDGAERLRDYAHRWAESAANSREHSRDVERLLTQINRRASRDGGGTPAAHQLRQLLAGLIQAADSDLHQILNCAHEIERCTQEIASGAEDQAQAVSKSTSYVEQMSTNIDSIAENAGGAHTAANGARESATEALDLVGELIRGMNRIRTHMEASEKKLRALGDRSHEIGSIVETIGAISSRTDLLALNASIESVRAGEHGRGFAVVADEVRNLAEQAAQATREVAGLIESIQKETQESISVMADERSQVEDEVHRANSAGDALGRIDQASSDSAVRVEEISRSTQQQLRLMQEVVLAMERISEVAKGNRSRAEGVCWVTRTLTKLAVELDGSLAPLRGCSEQAASAEWARGTEGAAPSGRTRPGQSRESAPRAIENGGPPAGYDEALIDPELVEIG